jgi:predicted alpha/beta-hydrolase family hydrolase
MKRDDQYERQGEGSRTEGHMAALRALAYLLQRVERFPDKAEEEQAGFLRGLGVSASDSALVRELGRMMPELLGPRLRRLCLPWPVVECEIGWYPSVLAPVFHGIREFDTNDGAPVKLRVFYPTTDGAVFDASFLANCGAYPLVILLHGQPPGGGCDFTNMYTRWELLPAALARSGYVVVAPQVAHVNFPSPQSPDLDTARRVLHWMRFTSEYQNHLMAPTWTGVVGHSYGAILGAFLAPQVGASAYVSLSADWERSIVEGERPSEHLPALGMPTLLAWGTGEDAPHALPGVWNDMAAPKHKLVFAEGAHHDYLNPDPESPWTTCGQFRGPCNLVEGLAADFVTMFLSKYLPPERHSTLSNLIAGNLMPPANVELTVEQQFFAGGHLSSLSLICAYDTCSVTHEWETVDSLTDTDTLSHGTC